jgi:hypothetical protein
LYSIKAGDPDLGGVLEFSLVSGDTDIFQVGFLVLKFEGCYIIVLSAKFQGFSIFRKSESGYDSFGVSEQGYFYKNITADK